MPPLVKPVVPWIFLGLAAVWLALAYQEAVVARRHARPTARFLFTVFMGFAHCVIGAAVALEK